MRIAATRMGAALWAALSLVAASATALSAATNEIAPGADVAAAAARLRPGDELVLREGTYLFKARPRVTATGTAAAPIVIRAARGAHVVVQQTNPDANVIEIFRSQHMIVRGIEFVGGSHGVHIEDADFITVEDCHIHDTGDVAIAANSGGTYEGLRLLRNHIHDTGGSGEGMYLGCNNDACRVANSLIEGNHIHDTNRPGVKQGDGIELKEGSYANIIRNNVVHDTPYPGIITYGTVGNGAANLIEGNVVWNVGGDDDNAIQSAADAIIRNNIVLGAPIALQKHQHASPANIQVVNNTIVSRREAIVVHDVAGSVVIANNAVYAQVGPAIRLVSGNMRAVTITGNVGSGGLTGASSGFSPGQGLAFDFADASARTTPPIDVFPKIGSALNGAADKAFLPANDFNGTARNGAVDVGAYRFAPSGNPGWRLNPSFKTLTSSH